MMMILEQQDILPSSISQLQIIIELALQIFYAVTNDLIELRDMSTMCIKDFLRSNSKKMINDDAANHDYRMLYQKEFFTKVFSSLHHLPHSPIFSFLGLKLRLHTFDEYSQISRYAYC